jgi:hypothetical protein
MFAPLTALWARLSRTARVLVALSFLALLLSAATFGRRAYQRHRLANEQARATAASAARQVAAAQAYHAYQLDSTARAIERRYLLENAHTQAQCNEALLRFRPALIDLPERPPVER